MASILTGIKYKVSIYAHRKVRGLLEGEYGSVFKGRSMDFEDIREYIPGDDVKDIDWKATARASHPLVKRYVAIRKHNILFVVDTGKNMAASSASGEPKRDIAVMATGVIGVIAEKHGDLVSAAYGDSVNNHYIPLKGTSAHLEYILQNIHDSISRESADSNLASQLNYISRSIRRRMMLFIISDDLALSTEHEQLLRRLQAQHELLWLTIGDADPTDPGYSKYDVVDIEDDATIPAFIRANKSLRQDFDAATKERRESTRQLLERLQITSERITSEADVIPGIYKLLERQKYAKRR